MLYYCCRHVFNDGLIEVMEHYGWKHIALLADQTKWGQGILATLIPTLKVHTHITPPTHLPPTKRAFIFKCSLDMGPPSKRK